MSCETNLYKPGFLNNSQPQTRLNNAREYDLNEQSFNPNYENLYRYTIQLSDLLISMNLTSIEDIKLESDQINKNIPEINRLINIIIQNLLTLGIPPIVAVGSRPTTIDIYSILCFASLLLYNHKSIKKNFNELPPQSNLNNNNNKFESNTDPENNDKTRAFVLESEIQSLKIKFQGLNEECQKRRSKIRSLQADNNNLQNKNQSLEKEINKLKLQIEQLQIEKEAFLVTQKMNQLDAISKREAQTNNEGNKDPNKTNNYDINSLKLDIEIRTKENLKLNRALIEISKEMEKNSLNLENELIQKNKFISIVQQQLIVLDEYERMYQSYQTKINKAEATLQAAQLTIQHLEEKQKETQTNNNNSDTLDSLKIYFSSKSDFNKNSKNNFDIITNILSILQSNNKQQNDKTDHNSISDNFVYSKVIEIFDFLFSKLKELNDKVNSYHMSTDVVDLREMTRIKKVNERFSQYIMSMVQFFEHLANSSEMQGWMIELPCNDDLRPLLLSQCNKVENFVRKNIHCKDFYEIKNENEMKKQLGDVITNVSNENILSLPLLVEQLLTESDESNQKAIQSLFGQEKEFLIILHLCASANDALRRCAEHTIESNRLLSDEIITLRRELQLASQDAESRIHEVTESLETKIQEGEESLKNAEDLLRSIQEELRRSEGADFDNKNLSRELFVSKKIIKKCLAILNGDESALNQLDEEEDEAASYSSSFYDYSKSEKDGMSKKVTSKNDEEEKLKNEIETLKKQVHFYEQRQSSSDTLEKRNKSLEVEKKKYSSELTNTKQKLKELKKELENISNENNALKNQIQKLKQSEKNYLKDSVTVSELTEEIENLRQKNEELNTSYDKEKKVTRKAVKNTIKSLKDEIAIQQKKNEDLKNHFEPLLDDLKIKLKEEHENMTKSMDKERELSLQNKQLTSELSTTKVDLKMLQMRITAIEEKVQRDKKLIETQCKMKILNYQTKCQSEIETLKSSFDCKTHNFQIAIVQHFKEFVNFRNKINEDSVFEVLDHVSSELERLNRLCSTYELINKDMSAIKALIGGFDSSTELNDDIESNNQLLIKITELVQTKNLYSQLKSDFEDLHKKLERDQNNSDNPNNENLNYFNDNFESVSSHEWEQWARKVAALASDNFLLLRSARELQSSIEEALLGSINQRMMTKRLEILRIEKRILCSGLLNNSQNEDKYITINTLIIIISAVRKLQKVSGHLPYNIPQPIRALEIMKKKNAGKKNM
ncbi:hypothetical protein M9Y10_021848 [Tritrichomonas musculus]|uniref:Uncharacterized protein n=1 Tax=Tritrichomonas musculus TaxID=1915356 RepID=A0ABR2KQW0_9EUKA